MPESLFQEEALTFFGNFREISGDIILVFFFGLPPFWGIKALPSFSSNRPMNFVFPKGRPRDGAEIQAGVGEMQVQTSSQADSNWKGLTGYSGEPSL